MRSLEFLGLCVLIYGCGWLTWKYFQPDYERLKKEGGPEWSRTEKVTTWAVVAGALIGGTAIAALLVRLDPR